MPAVSRAQWPQDRGRTRASAPPISPLLRSRRPSTHNRQGSGGRHRACSIWGSSCRPARDDVDVIQAVRKGLVVGAEPGVKLLAVGRIERLRSVGGTGWGGGDDRLPAHLPHGQRPGLVVCLGRLDLSFIAADGVVASGDDDDVLDSRPTAPGELLVQPPIRAWPSRRWPRC